MSRLSRRRREALLEPPACFMMPLADSHGGEGNCALHNQPLLVVHDDLQALELVAIHGPHPAPEGGALIELKFGCIGTGTTRSARLSENRRDDFTPLDRPYQDRAVEYDVFGKQLAHLGGGRLTGFP